MIVLDTVNELHWAVDPRTHPIRIVVERLLGENSDWFGPSDDELDSSSWKWKWGRGERGKDQKRSLPPPVPEEEDCLVCSIS
jgi:hypothetical protein